MRSFSVALLALITGCSSTPKPAEGPAAGAAAPLTAAPTDDPGHTAHRAAIDAAPASAAVIVTLEVGSMLEDALVTGFLPTKRDPGAFKKALGEASKKDFGIDVLATRTLSGWVVVEAKAMALIAHGPYEGALAIAGLETADVEGYKALALEDDLFLALVDGRLVLGNRAAFRLLKTPPAEPGLREKHRAVLGALAGGRLEVTAAVPEVLAPRLPIPGLESAGLTISSELQVHAAASGAAAGLDLLVTMIEQLRGPAVLQLKAALAVLEAQSFPGASVAALVLRASVEDIEALTFTQRPSPTLLTGETPRVKLSSAAAFVIPTLAAVAVPAFVKYVRRSKSMEARLNLDKIAKSAVAYYETPRVGSDGQPLPCAFPPSVGATPPTDAACCDGTRGEEGRCTPQPADWEQTAWQALRFNMESPHYFHYRFESYGEGASAKFTASAYADLDCDGEFSTFERHGSGGAEGALDQPCAAEGSPAMYTESETE